MRPEIGMYVDWNHVSYAVVGTCDLADGRAYWLMQRHGYNSGAFCTIEPDEAEELTVTCLNTHSPDAILTNA